MDKNIAICNLQFLSFERRDNQLNPRQYSVKNDGQIEKLTYWYERLFRWIRNIFGGVDERVRIAFNESIAEFAELEHFNLYIIDRKKFTVSMDNALEQIPKDFFKQYLGSIDPSNVSEEETDTDEDDNYGIQYSHTVFEEQETVIQQHPVQATKPSTELLKKHEEAILEMLECPISMEVMEDPFITEEGQTYSLEALEEWHEKHKTDPKTGTKLDMGGLRGNLLIESIANACNKNVLSKATGIILSLDDWKNDPILRLFEDPKTKKLMKDPYIGEDNITYEKGTLGKGKLYHNLLANQILESRIKQINEFNKK